MQFLVGVISPCKDGVEGWGAFIFQWGGKDPASGRRRTKKNIPVCSFESSWWKHFTSGPTVAWKTTFMLTFHLRRSTQKQNTAARQSKLFGYRNKKLRGLRKLTCNTNSRNKNERKNPSVFSGSLLTAHEFQGLKKPNNGVYKWPLFQLTPLLIIGFHGWNRKIPSLEGFLRAFSYNTILLEDFPSQKNGLVN